MSSIRMTPLEVAEVGKPKHTPGPWAVESGGFVGGPVGYGRVCQTWNKFEEDFRNAEANAHLIAAAPELLEALKAMTATFTHDSACTYYYGPVIEDSRCDCVRKDAIAAIAKAESR